MSDFTACTIELCFLLIASAMLASSLESLVCKHQIAVSIASSSSSSGWDTGARDRTSAIM